MQRRGLGLMCHARLPSAAERRLIEAESGLTVSGAIKLRCALEVLLPTDMALLVCGSPRA
ncbi:hypothetical protein PLESTB_001118800 [Pleodorina starrii]|uniref:Uncharacterized protein n=1 Tax=Pleodorina starrii TaxID=330485 RepID=A0A9W6BQU5_9CHLO|nr:hypothetical protein PLESTB_001118800 [Pleodorina starrii]GLC68787.1 hypothetical protein PLESTF_000736700 [Pleodorina starrii]